MSAGSKTDVGAYHRDDSKATEDNLGDLHGQFTLSDHRPGVFLSFCPGSCCPRWEGGGRRE